MIRWSLEGRFGALVKVKKAADNISEFESRFRWSYNPSQHIANTLLTYATSVIDPRSSSAPSPKAYLKLYI